MTITGNIKELFVQRRLKTGHTFHDTFDEVPHAENLICTLVTVYLNGLYGANIGVHVCVHLPQLTHSAKEVSNLLQTFWFLAEKSVTPTNVLVKLGFRGGAFLVRISRRVHANHIGMDIPINFSVHPAKIL
jgi:hypothetical protein